MWDEYGDRHRGVCLAFSRERLEARIRDELDAFSHYSGDVTYTSSGWAGSEAREWEGVSGLDRAALSDVDVMSHIERFPPRLLFPKDR